MLLSNSSESDVAVDPVVVATSNFVLEKAAALTTMGDEIDDTAAPLVVASSVVVTVRAAGLAAVSAVYPDLACRVPEGIRMVHAVDAARAAVVTVNSRVASAVPVFEAVGLLSVPNVVVPHPEEVKAMVLTRSKLGSFKVIFSVVATSTAGVNVNVAAVAVLITGYAIASVGVPRRFVTAVGVAMFSTAPYALMDGVPVDSRLTGRSAVAAAVIMVQAVAAGTALAVTVKSTRASAVPVSAVTTFVANVAVLQPFLVG